MIRTHSPTPALAAVLLALHLCGCSGTATKTSLDTATTAPTDTLEALIDDAYESGRGTLSIGERVARFGLALEGTPYADGTLEAPGREVCRVTTSSFDCVTFMELCLNLARVTGVSGAGPQDVRDAVQFTRYRGGRLTDYTSRLHYTSEWISDNVKKGVLEDVTAPLGGEDCSATIDFMTKHPDSYAALQANPAFVDSMRRIEQAINQTPRTCIPKDRVAAIESKLETGDLIAVATSIKGLDYSHTGMVVLDEQGAARFLHASSKHGRVTLDVSLSRYLAEGPKHVTGVTVARPLEVRGSR